MDEVVELHLHLRDLLRAEAVQVHLPVAVVEDGDDVVLHGQDLAVAPVEDALEAGGDVDHRGGLVLVAPQVDEVGPRGGRRVGLPDVDVQVADARGLVALAGAGDAVIGDPGAGVEPQREEALALHLDEPEVVDDDVRRGVIGRRRDGGAVVGVRRGRGVRGGGVGRGPAAIGAGHEETDQHHDEGSDSSHDDLLLTGSDTTGSRDPKLRGPRSHCLSGESSVSLAASLRRQPKLRHGPQAPETGSVKGRSAPVQPR